MMTFNRETAIRKITEMPESRVSKVLIFMAGMEAENAIGELNNRVKQPHNDQNRQREGGGAE